MSDIIKTQRSLAIKAKFQKEHQFDHLHRLICRRDWIADALETILSNKGSKTAGIDGAPINYDKVGQAWTKSPQFFGFK